MPPSQIFVSTRTRREFQRRRSAATYVPVSMLVAVLLAAWVLAAVMLWWGWV